MLLRIGLALLFSLSFASAADRGLDGTLLEKGTRKPLSDVNIYLLPSKLKATTDSEGRFSFDKVPVGQSRFVINLTGYERMEREVDILEKPAAEPLVLYLERTSYQVYETTIFGKENKRDRSTRSLKASEFLQLPGSGGDPIKAIQNLPGINRPRGFDSRVVIQGSSPRDTRYAIDGHEVPLVFHFGGLTSVTFPEALDRVDYLSAGYGPEYGRAMGGLVSVWTRKPRRARLHGLAFVDTFNAGGLIEGPIGEESSFLFSIRQSYVGQFLKAFAEDNEDFDLTVAPTFGDITGIYESRLTPRDEFKLVTVGSRDSLEFILAEPVERDPEIRGNFESETNFFRLIPQLTHRHGNKTYSRWSFGLGRDWIRFVTTDNFFRIRTWSLTARGELESQINPWWKGYWGYDNRYVSARVDISLPVGFIQGGVPNPLSSGETQQVGLDAKSNQAGVYWRNEFKPVGSKWTLMPNLRVDRFGNTNQNLLAPRTAVRYDFDSYLSYRVAGGLYHQPVREQEVDENFGNPDIEAPRAWHLATSVEKDFREGRSDGFRLTLGSFYRFFDQLVVQSPNLITREGQTVAERYNNSGKGTAFGGEMLLRYDLHPFKGWISYTLSRSRRWSAFQANLPSSFDQTHNLNLIGSVDLPKNWKISTRFRYVTGNPNTPVVSGILDADNDVYIPVRGVFFSERLNPFVQWDVRVDKKWIYDKWILSVYLDIQNITNRKNIEALSYAYDYSSRTEISGLPILPTFGVKGEF